MVRCSRVEPKAPGLSPIRLFFYFFLFFPFFVLLFSINIYLNNCHLIKCNKQQEKYRVSRKKIVHRVLNIWITIWISIISYNLLWENQSWLPLDHSLNNVPTSSFYRLILIITFQHVNRTFNVIFDSFKSHCLTNTSINRICRSTTIF